MSAPASTKNSTYNVKNGRYVLGGTTEVSTFALEWWDRNDLPKDPTDIVYSMERKYEGNPEILGKVFYGDRRLWWVICQYNGIVDPMDELVEGKILLIPTLDRVKKNLFSSNTKTGGISSTR
jgi:hypothetical protein